MISNLKKILVLITMLWNVTALLAMLPEVAEIKVPEKTLEALYQNIEKNVDEYKLPEERRLNNEEINNLKKLVKNKRLLNEALFRSEDISSTLEKKINTLNSRINNHLQKAQEWTSVAELFIEEGLREPINLNKELQDLEKSMQEALEWKSPLGLPDVLEDPAGLKKMEEQMREQEQIKEQEKIKKQMGLPDILEQPELIEELKQKKVQEFKDKWLENNKLKAQEILSNVDTFLKESRNLDPQLLDNTLKQALQDFANFMENQANNIKSDSDLIQNITWRIQFLRQQYQLLKDANTLEKVVTNILKDTFRLLPEEEKELIPTEKKLQHISTFIKSLDKFVRKDRELFKSILSTNMSEQIQKLKEFIVYEQRYRILEPAYEVLDVLEKYLPNVRLDVDNAKKAIIDLALREKQASKLSLDNLNSNINTRIETLKKNFKNLKPRQRVLFAQGILRDIFQRLPEFPREFAAEPLGPGEEVKLEDLISYGEQLSWVNTQLEKFNNFLQNVSSEEQQEEIFSVIKPQVEKLSGDFALKIIESNEYTNLQNLIESQKK